MKRKHLATAVLLAFVGVSLAVRDPDGGSGSCGCVRPAPESSLSVHGIPVVIDGLPLIFEHLAKRGLEPGAGQRRNPAQNRPYLPRH